MPYNLSFFWPSVVLEVVSLAFLLIVVMTAASVRNEPDARGRRLTATFLSVVMFVSLFAVLFSVTSAVASLSRLVGNESSDTYPGAPSFDDDESGFERFEYGVNRIGAEAEGDEEDVAAAVRSLLVAGVAAGVLLYHRRRLLDLLADGGESEGGDPAVRIVHGYLYGSQAVGLLLFVVGASLGLYGFAKVLVPEALSSREAGETRDEAAGDVFTGAFLAVGSLAIVRLHQDERARMDGDDRAGDDDEDEPPTDEDVGDYPIA